MREAINRKLLDAAKTGNENGIKSAIASGAEINCVDTTYYHYTPLLWAAGHNFPSAVKLLLSYGANPRAGAIGTHTGLNPLSITEITKNAEIRQIISAAMRGDILSRQHLERLEQRRKTFGDSSGVVHKQMWKPNRGSNYSPENPITGVPSSGLLEQALQNYLARNSNPAYAYSAQDNPNGRAFERFDGTYTWANPNADPSNPCSAVRYIEGPQTRVWITQRDSNYLARVAREEAKQTTSFTEFFGAFFAALQKKAEREQQAAMAAAEAESQRQAAIAAEHEAARIAAQQAEVAHQAAIQLAAQQEAARIAEMQRQAELQRQAAEAEHQRQTALAAEAERQATIAAEQEAARIAVEAERQRQVAEQAAREQSDRAILDVVRVRPTPQRLFSRTNSNNTFTRSQSNPMTSALNL